MYAITIKKQDGDEPERVTVFEEIPMNRAYERYYGEAAIQGKYRAAMTGETTVWLHFQNKVLENLYLLNKTLQHETDDLDNSDANG